MIFKTNDALKDIKEYPDYNFHDIFCDPPYALGSEVIIREDGKPDYRKAVDFMDKWDMPDGTFWEMWFKEAYRVLKHGGFCVIFGMDRVNFLMKYYATLAGFKENMSIYWYFMQSFPKASDLSKRLDWHFFLVEAKKHEIFHVKKRELNKKDFCLWLKEFRKELGMERIETGGTRKRHGGGVHSDKISQLNPDWKETKITEPFSELGRQFDGFKYGIASFKQCVEEVMVFQKPYKVSCLHDTLAMESGDDSCSCGAVNIDENRVDFVSPADRLESTLKNQHDDFGTEPMIDNNVYGDFSMCQPKNYNPSGRFPAQCFCDNDTAEILDKQSGMSKSTGGRSGNENKYHGGFPVEYYNGMKPGFGDVGGCSKILHKCDFETEDYDLYYYCPKVSKTERCAGLGDMNINKINHPSLPISNMSWCKRCNNKVSDSDRDTRPNSRCFCGDKRELYYKEKDITPTKNHHPCLKPISLIYRITKLFKLPTDNQKIYVPFAGTLSEVIGAYKAGFQNITSCDINPEYTLIGEARFNYWKNKFDEETMKEREKNKQQKL